MEDNATDATPVVTIRHHLDPGHILRDYLYTIVISVVISLFLKFSGFIEPFIPNLIFSLSMGLTICTLALSMIRLFNPRTDRPLSIFLILVGSVLGAVFLVSRLMVLLSRVGVSTTGDYGAPFPLKTVVTALFFGGGATYFFFSKARLRTVRELMYQEQRERLANEKAVAEANLRLLQAQIEPHFLFNTLSNVVSLIDTRPARGKEMLMDLTRYLRTTLSRTLPETTTLGQEVEIVRAYLNIQKIRLDDRLRFDIRVPEPLSKHPFPPMLLQPLVENALKHGIEPKIEGGDIRITAFGQGETLRIEVADTGIGFSAFSSDGVGIANVTQRIRLMYGDRGRLRIEENTPVGVKAVIEVPHAL